MFRNRLWVSLKPELVYSRLRTYELVAVFVLLVICILDEYFAISALRIRVLPDISRCCGCYSRESSACSGQRLYNIVYLRSYVSVGATWSNNLYLKKV